MLCVQKFCGSWTRFYYDEEEWCAPARVRKCSFDMDPSTLLTVNLQHTLSINTIPIRVSEASHSWCFGGELSSTSQSFSQLIGRGDSR